MEVNVIMPMLGCGTRMQGIQKTCKPLMQFKNGKYFFLRALESLQKNYRIKKLVLVVLSEYFDDFMKLNISNKVDCDKLIVKSSLPTKNPVETFKIGLNCLEKDGKIDLPIISLDCDIYSELPAFEDVKHAGIFYFIDNNPNKSFIKTHCGYVCDITEKVPISNMAVFGAYMFDDFSVLNNALNTIVVSNYMSDVVREILLNGGLVKARQLEKVYNYGTLKELEQYERETLSSVSI